MAELKKLNLSDPVVSAPAPSAAPATTAPAPAPFTRVTPMQKTKSSSLASIVLPILVVLALGIGSGYGLFVATGSSSSGSAADGQSASVSGGKIKVGETFGLEESQAGKDNTEGVLEKGGIDGEGSHKLLKPGGESQTVYLTSSVVDLDEYVGHKVKVWGSTFTAQKAGWLMDVGRVKIVELDADKPF